MLEIKNINKSYKTGDFKQKVLKNVSIKFRKNEFVSILGHSGSGKTTLLNLIGGLDRYDSGDIIINGKSTKNFKDKDWDAYRNNSIGFIFQSYNLISHISILDNVEMGMTLSGISRKKRHMKAIEVLKRVGLEEHINKKPNQLSGGQCQRVAIARALVNDPEILLADEPTGALDSKTSVEVMNILKNISKDKLVIMVTHNEDLAKKYSTRIISIQDGSITGDTNPYNQKDQKDSIDNNKKTSMSFLTALSLSFNNLLTKKGRTFLTAFAGSIGIIGISLILSLSNGVNEYIRRVQEDTLTSYPISIESATADMASMMLEFSNQIKRSEHTDNKIYSNDIMVNMIERMSKQIKTNDLKEFKKYIEDNKSELGDAVNDVRYKYNLDFQIYSKDTTNITKLNPSVVFSMFGMQNNSMYTSSYMDSRINVFNEISDNKDLLNNTYDVVAGRLPNAKEEIVLILDSYGEISDYTLYTLGIKDQKELTEMMKKIMSGEKLEQGSQSIYNYEDFLNKEFKLVLNTDYYLEEQGKWVDKSNNKEYMKKLIDKSLSLKIVGIIKPNSESSLETSGEIGYTSELTKYVIDKINSTKIAKEQILNKEKNIITNIPFSELYTYEMALSSLGIVDVDTPSTINIYPKDFKSKDKIVEFINEYNNKQKDNEELTISYTDYVAILMNSVTTIIDVISYVLIAFVSISLVVSSIMIGIITYISVLERTKEIGILRAIGARKKDIRRVFNAETFIIGLASGVLGISITILLNIPINIIINNLYFIINFYFN